MIKNNIRAVRQQLNGQIRTMNLKLHDVFCILFLFPHVHDRLQNAKIIYLGDIWPFKLKNKNILYLS